MMIIQIKYFELAILINNFVPVKRGQYYSAFERWCLLL